MKAFKRGFLGALAIVAIFVSVGCSSYQTEEAKKLNKDGDAHINKYIELDDELEKIANNLGEVDITPAEAKRALELVKQAKGNLNNQKSEMQAAEDDYEKIKSLNVSEEFKTYASKKIAACDAVLEMIGYGSQLIDEFDKFFKGVKSRKLTKEGINSFQKNIESTSKKIDVSKEKFMKLSKEVDDYAKDKNLPVE